MIHHVCLALRAKSIKPIARLILTYLCDWSNHEDICVLPDVNDLSARLRIGKGAVSSALDMLYHEKIISSDSTGCKINIARLVQLSQKS